MREYTIHCSIGIAIGIVFLCKQMKKVHRHRVYRISAFVRAYCSRLLIQ